MQFTDQKRRSFLLIIALVSAGIALFSLIAGFQGASIQVEARAAAGSSFSADEIHQEQVILVDDFVPQPYQGDSIYYYNRLGSDRGALNHTVLDFGEGEVTATLGGSDDWGGMWVGLSHPSREKETINFSSILPDQIEAPYQSQITGLTIDLLRGTPSVRFKIELKDGAYIRWTDFVYTTGGTQTLEYDLPTLNDMTELVLVIDLADPGDYVVLDQIAFTATTQITDVMEAAYVWSYAMLLNNWNPESGLIRDKAKEASGEFDAIQATGTLAAATAQAEQLGVVNTNDAIQIVNKISDTLMMDIPRYHGLWPHWVELTATDTYTILLNSEWSSVDTTIAAIALLDAQSALGLDTSTTIQFIRDIDWADLLTPTGLSHGYTYIGEKIIYAWDAFGGESWLIELAYAAANQTLAPLEFPNPPTANGSGFIDELAWQFVLPPNKQDVWGTDWDSYRQAAVISQTTYYSINYPISCFSQIGLFGLSAGEVPAPSDVPKAGIYQAFGIGGQFSPPNDGSGYLAGPVVVPHYVAMIAPLAPTDAISMWAWLVDGPFSPLNNIESLLFPSDTECGYDAIFWNHLKGSWNLSLQALGLGQYLALRDGKQPVLWQATLSEPFLRAGYNILVPDGITSVHMPLVVDE